MDTLEKFYREWRINSKLVHQPKKEVFTNGCFKGDFRVMPCVIHPFEGQTIKAVKVIGTNEEERVVPDKICVGKAMLINATDNFVEALFDVCALSSFRTAALSVLAFKHAGTLEKETVGVVGAGRIGYYTAFILSRWCGLDTIYVYDHHQKRVSEFKKLLDRSMEIKPVTMKVICRQSTALFLSTTSRKPVLKISDAGDINFISSVGADADNLSEIDPGFAGKWTIVSESRQNIHFGDMKRWHDDGLMDKTDIVELRKIVTSTKKKREKVLFISTGTAVQDALICHFLFHRLKKANQ